MKNPDRKTVSALTELPNVGKAIAMDLRRVGIDHPQQLVGQDAYELYKRLCKVSGTRHDPCVIDVFLSIISFMEGEKPQPWWFFTDARKKALTHRCHQP